MKKTKPLVPQNIEDLKAYVAGKTIAEVVEAYHPAQIAKLASNENGLGCSPFVKPAIDKAFSEIQNYPDPLSYKLKEAIARRNGVKPGNVIVSSGSESIIAMLCHTFFLNKENAVTADATFVGFFVQIGIRGIKLKKIPITADFRFDIKAIVNAIDAHTKMIYIANPNNPTGTYINKTEFEWLMSEVSKDVLVVIDEAYYEYTADIDDYPKTLDYDYCNVVVLRTFSKAYGLAGFRVGYAMASETLINYLAKTKMTFEPGTLGQAAALAALNDQDFLNKSVEVVQAGKEKLYSFFDRHGINYVKSVSNSVLIVFNTEKKATDFTQAMLEKGVILRKVNAFGLPNCVRITIGTPESMNFFEKSFLETQKNSFIR